MPQALENRSSDTVTAEEALPRIVRRIVDLVHPEKIILFGSRARGTPRETSDIDLLVIESEPFGPGRSKLDELGRIDQTLRGCGFPTDVLVYSRDEVEKWRSAINHVVARALEEGKILYEQS